MFLVRNRRSEKLLWLATVEANGDVFVWLANVGEFCRNWALTVNRQWEGDFTFTPIEPAEAAEVIRAGQVGRLDRRSMGDVVHELATSPRKSALEVLGFDPQDGTNPALRQLDEAPAGQWVDYRTLPAAQRHRAQVCATDLRTGRIKTVAARGPVQVRVIDTTDDQVRVQIRRGEVR